MRHIDLVLFATAIAIATLAITVTATATSDGADAATAIGVLTSMIGISFAHRSGNTSQTNGGEYGAMTTSSDAVPSHWCCGAVYRTLVTLHQSGVP